MLFRGKTRERCLLVSSIRLAEAQALPAPGVGEQRVALLSLCPQKKNIFDLILHSKNSTELFFVSFDTRTSTTTDKVKLYLYSSEPPR